MNNGNLNKRVAIAVLACASIAAMPAAADPSDDFAYIFQATINEGVSVEDVEAVLKEGAAAIADFDGTLVWDISVVGNRIHGYERFENEAAFFGHVEALGDTLPKFLAVWSTEAIIATTPMPESIAEAFGSFGAPVITVDASVTK